MKHDLKTYREKRANVWSQMQEIRTAVDTDGWSAELRQKWDSADADLLVLTADIERFERDGALDGKFAEIDAEHAERAGATGPLHRGGDDEAVYRKAFENFMRRGIDDLEPDEKKLVRSKFGTIERAQGGSTGGAGGYAVPQGFWAKVTETMKYFGGVLQSGVETLDTDSGNDIPWPTNDDTANMGALLSENTQIGGGDLTFGQAELGAHMYTSKLILVSLQLLQDAGVDVEGFVARKIGQRLGRVFNNHWTVGTGANQPQGFITGSTLGKTAASATMFTYPEMVDLVHSVDAAYRAEPGSVGFQMHDLVLAAVRKMTDSQNRPLWQPSMSDGDPDRILGYAYFVNNDMDSTVATTKKTMAFGNWRSGYVVRRVNGAQVMRLTERYADYLQVGFFGFQRADGLVQDSSAIKYLQQA
jgi:HK97 family phage major capsid protein